MLNSGSAAPAALLPTSNPLLLSCCGSVIVRNRYFEPTPLDLLTAVVTEEGQLEPAAIAAAVQERRRLYRTAFQLP